MTQKKIVFFMPSIEGGGVEKNLFIISNYFAKKVDKIYLITASKKFSNKFDKKINLICPKLFIWDNFGRRFKYFICILLLIKFFLKEKEFLVFCFQANIYCIIICKLLGIKIVVRSNSSPFGWSNSVFKNFVFKKILKKADKIIANSIQFKKLLEKKYHINVTCIYNPLNKKEIISLSKIKHKTIFKKKNSLKIINVGRFVDQKDHMTLLKAINILKNKLNLEVRIIGRGIENDNMNNFIIQNNLNKIIKLINFQKNPFPYIKNADLFILTSRFEGLPNVLLEAITLNKFVISSDCSTGPSEILDRGKGGLLFKVGDYKALADKILFYTRKKSFCKNKLGYAKKRLARFDYYKNLNLYLREFKKII